MVGGVGSGNPDCPTTHNETRKWCGPGTERSAGASRTLSRVPDWSKPAVPASRFTKPLARGIVRASKELARNRSAMKVAFIKARR